LFGADQFVLASAHEVGQIVEELADIGGADEELQIQFANAPAEVHPKIGIFKQAKMLAMADKKFVAVGVEGLGLELGKVGTAELQADAFSHFLGGVLGVSNGQDFFRTNPFITNQSRNATDEDRGLAGTGTGNHQHGPVNMLNRLTLAVIRKES
jgi:hypothetical protein